MDSGCQNNERIRNCEAYHIDKAYESCGNVHLETQE